MCMSGSLGEQLIKMRPCAREKMRLALLQSSSQVLLDVMDEVGVEGVSSCLQEERVFWLGPKLQEIALKDDDFVMEMVRHGLPLDARIYANGLAPRTPLSFFIEGGNISRTREVLALGADPNDYGVASEHPLNVACSLRSADSALRLVELLLVNGSDPNGYDKQHTPLFCLAEQGWIEPALLLLNRGAHGAMSTITDRSVVEMARIKGNDQWADTVEAILAARQLKASTPEKSKTGERIRL